MRELHLFAGIGGGILGGGLLGHTCVGAVEIDPFCRQVLRARQADGVLPAFPIRADVRRFTGARWHRCADVVAGGFPCQDISYAGNGAGLKGKRSGLWFEMLRVVREVEPAFVFVENVPALVRRGIGVVLGGLAEFGFDAEWDLFSAAAVGAPHLRRRIWILAAHPGRVAQWGQQHATGEGARTPEAHAARNGTGRQLACSADAGGQRQQDDAQPDGAANVGCEGTERGHHAHGLRDVVPDADCFGRDKGPELLPARQPDSRRHGEAVPYCNGARLAQRPGQRCDAREELAPLVGADWWATEPRVGRVAHGVPARVDRLRTLGNAQLPQVVARAWRELERRLLK